MRQMSVLVGLFYLLLGATCLEARPRSSEWTVMVFMNAKNNLEEDGINDFLEMAAVGSTSDVNVVVQFGRPAEHYDRRYGAWSGVRRYHVKKGDEPLADKALAVVEGAAADMGKPDSLIGFVTWARSSFPAKRYALVIWNHGQGWRLQLDSSQGQAQRAARSDVAARASEKKPRIIGGFRSVSHDEDTGNILLNRQIQDSLGAHLKGERLEIVGFDACLMAMIETAFAMRGLAKHMVASQELEPGAGWQYDVWLRRLVEAPQVEGAALGKLIVEAYRERYGDQYKTTLSSVDLTQALPLSANISAIADHLIAAGGQGLETLRRARSGLKSYGDDQTQPNYVDLGLLLDRLGNASSDERLKELVRVAQTGLSRMVTANYRSRRLERHYGSNGVSIFLPEDKQAFELDPDKEGYLQRNQAGPVEFVQTYRWACLVALHVGLDREECPPLSSRVSFTGLGPHGRRWERGRLSGYNEGL